MYIYGFDLSMSNSGIAIFDFNGNIKHICSVATNDKETHGKRLKTIADFIVDLQKQYPAKTVVIERGFARFNIATSVIYRVHGLVNFLFWDTIQIYYPPKTVKEAIVNGKATKEQVRKEIENHYPEIVFNNEDESDAVATGLTYFIKKKSIIWR